MAGLPKDDILPDFQCGREIFNDKDLPQALRSSCLALIPKQEIHSNPLLLSEIPSPKKKHYMNQIAYPGPRCSLQTSERKPNWTVNLSTI
jgi:hypothetical protein